MLAVVLVAGGAYVLINFLGRDVPSSGPSMRPTLSGTGTIEVDYDAFDEAPPQRGDIVGLQAPGGIEEGLCGVSHPEGSPCPVAPSNYERLYLAKRVVGLPGDEVAFSDDGGLILNGELQDEPYILHCPGTCGLPRAITVPEGHYFVAGDNRPRSSDSRIWGAVPLDAIEGRILVDSG